MIIFLRPPSLAWPASSFVGAASVVVAIGCFSSVMVVRAVRGWSATSAPRGRPRRARRVRLVLPEPGDGLPEAVVDGREDDDLDAAVHDQGTAVGRRPQWAGVRVA